VERDRVARALPEGFTPGVLRRRLVDPATLARAAPRTAALLRRIEAGRLRAFLLDLTEPEPRLGLGLPRRRRSRSDLSLPCAAALLLDVEGGPVPVAAGYACRLGRDAALAAALLEAAQSRATEIHGAREDVLVGDRRAAEALRGILEAARPTRPAAALPDLRARTPAAGVRAVVRRLVQVGVRPVAIDLPGPPGVAVTKVVAPGLLLSELL
jgi:ribosomal protein S12 methylthiotransferase accessory factor